jgi:hypothetical protein
MRVDELKKSYKKFGALYPVLIDQDGDTIDGFHRRKVNPKWPTMKIEVKDDIEKAKIALVSNILRREVSREEIKKRLDRVAELTGWKPKKIATEIGMSYNWVMKYISQKYKSEVKQKAGKKGGDKKSATRRVAEKQSQLPKGENSEDTITKEEKEELELELRNVWQTDEPREDYGDANFHGHTPPFILKQLFKKYTKEGDKIVDIMGGSGTSIDVGNDMKRKVQAFDIKPMREEIEKGDAINIKITRTKFVFGHWPYWNMVKYSKDKEDLSNKNYKEFINKSNKIFLNVYEQLKASSYFVVLIGDKRNSGKLEDLSAQLSMIGQMVGFTLFDKVIWVSRGQRSMKRIDSNLTKWRAEKHGYHIQTFDTLLIFKK